MAHRLDGCYVRLGRAREHLERLNALVVAFTRNDANRLIVKMDTEPPRYTATWEMDERPPFTWALLIGEMLYNMRSALDHLMWQLALEFGLTPHRQSIFPIYTKPRDFKHFAETKLLGFPNETLALLKTLQPFGGGQTQPRRIHGLWLLNELNNIDKHRDLHLAQFFVKSGKYTIDAIEPYELASQQVFTRGPLEHGTVLLRLDFVKAGKMHVKLNFTFDVTFDQAAVSPDIGIDLAELPVLDSLDGILTLLTEGLFPDFAGFFREHA